MRGSVFIALLALHCGADSGDGLREHHARRVSGAPGIAAEVTPLLGLFTVSARVEGTPTAMLVDTGAPLTFVSPAAGQSRGPTTLRALTVGGLTLHDVPAVVDDPFGLSPLIGGILGVNVICQFNATWDWRRQRFTLGDPPPDAEVERAETVVPFRLLGGGRLRTPGGLVDVPPTRIVVDAVVEGESRALVLDTGASTSALRSDLVARLARDRGSLSLRVTAQGGVSSQTLLRVRVVQALGFEARGVAVVGYDAAALDEIASELGTRVDGLLGADLLQGHLLSIAYPAGRLHLRRYLDQSHVRDRWTRVGLVAGRTAGAWRVADVFPGLGAARAGVAAGDSLIAIDGALTQGLTLDEVDRALTGSVGEHRTLRTTRGEFRVPVEDVAPLP